MGRRRDGLLDSLLEVASMLPWWVDCVVAAISYLVLHQLSLREVTAAAAPGQVSNMVIKTFEITLAKIGQYVVPSIFLIGAVVSAMRGVKRKGLLSRASAKSFPEIKSELSWREFEMLVGEHYRGQGYRVEETGGGGADGGIDLILRRDKQTVLVQCKHWKARTVGIKIVRELFGVLTAEAATRAILITSGQVTDEAVAFCRDKPIEIITGDDFDALIRSNKRAATKKAVESPQPLTPKPETGCPVCGSPMVKRQAAKGTMKGQFFYGCSRFPTCRGTRAF